MGTWAEEIFEYSEQNLMNECSYSIEDQNIGSKGQIQEVLVRGKDSFGC